MDRLARLIGIILHLQSKKIITAEDLSSAFNISTRTIYRDIQTLTEAGVPISASPSEGYRLIQSDCLTPIMFTHGEASALLMGTEFVIKKADAAYKKDAENALLKIKSILKNETKEYLEKIDQSTVIINNITSDKNILQNIQNSIAENRVIHLKYFSLSKNEVTERDIEPLGLIHYGENWRIIAYCRLRKDFREFRINRIKAIKFSEEIFNIRKRFVLSEFISKEYSIKKPVTVKIWFDSKTTRIIKEKYSQGLSHEEITRNGSILSFIYSEERLPEIAKWILSFHNSAEVLSPPSFRELIIKETRDILNLYS
jgi:predicted DNA-binding transcriptional regulator YafY